MRMIRLSALGAALLVIAGGACSRSAPEAQSASAPQVTAPAPSPAASPDDPGRPKIVALGDSLTAGYGLLEMQAYPALLQKKLDDDGYGWAVVNAGVSRGTSAAGPSRPGLGAPGAQAGRAAISTWTE